MFKTLCAFRGDGLSDPPIWVDSSYTFEWKWGPVGEAFNELIKLNKDLTVDLLIPPEQKDEFTKQMKELGHIWRSMSLRARLNNLEGPFLFDHEEPTVDDEVLLEWIRTNRNRKRRIR